MKKDRNESLKIKLFINSDVATTNASRYGDINPNLIEALKFMQNKWGHCFELSFFGDKITKSSCEIEGLNYQVTTKEELPVKINKLYQLIDAPNEFLSSWDEKSGKSIAYSYKKMKKTDSWNGFNISPEMTTDEIIYVLQHVMHLYS